MGYLLFQSLIILSLGYSFELADLAKSINSKKTTWKASDNVTIINWKSLVGTLSGDTQLPTKHVPIRGDIPESFDSGEHWPECQSINEIRDQSSCGDCYMIAAVESATDRLCIASHGEIQDRLSGEDVLACCDTCGGGCIGGFASTVWYWFNRTGVTTGGDYGSKEWCYPYSLPPCKRKGTAAPYPDCGKIEPTPTCKKQCQEGYPISYEKDKHFFNKPYAVERSEEAYQMELMTNGPFQVSFDMYEDFGVYKSGIYQHIEGKLVGGHSVKLVGWGVENGIPYWKVANSWNEYWGEKGFFRILRGKNECGIESSSFTGLPRLNYTVCFQITNEFVDTD